MNKSTNLIFVLLIIMVVWNVVLTSTLNNMENKEESQVNHYEVSGFSTDLTGLVEETKSSVVTISADNSISSGFIYSQKDTKVYIVTCFHSVSGASSVKVIFDSTYKVDASVLDYDIYSDIAVLECDIPYVVKTIKEGSSLLSKDGEYILHIGTAISSEYKASVEVGMISASHRVINNQIVYQGKTYDYFLDVIQLSSNLLKGYSGSPIFNMAGEVIGMVSMSDKEINFALTIEEIKEIVSRIINNEEVHKVNFGIKGTYISEMEIYSKSYNNIPLEMVDGLYVEKVKDASFAYSMGLKAKDIIISINGVNITNMSDMLKILYSGVKQFNVLVSRDTENLSLVGSIDD